MDWKKIGTYILAGSVALAGAEGCKGEHRRKPLTSPPLARFSNPHPNLFADVFDSSQDMLDGDFVLRYRWDADQKMKTGAEAQMDSISGELGGKPVSGYKTESGKFFLRVEDDSIDWAVDSNRDGTRDYIGEINQKNKLNIIDFQDFNSFATDLLSYSDAVQNAEFYTKENIVGIDDFKVTKIGNSGLYQSLPRIGNVKADIIIRYKDGSIDTLIFDTFSNPVDVLPAGDLDKLSQYFTANPTGKFANMRVFVFTDNHTADVRNKLGTEAKELRRYVMDRSLYR